MRYEDASQTGSINSGPTDARDDADALAAGARGPATGNVISGAGTQSGSLGADIASGDARIVSISGADGSDSSFSGGKLSVGGQHGTLSIDAQGNYSYVANRGAPENVRDPFTYKLAESKGGSDTATLTIEIGKSPTVVQANAQQIVPGPDGVVVLPAGVELSDISVVGRNLVITLPDGSQMVIVDGAVFVPQLVLGDVEVPAANLAALLIGSEPRPAAGSDFAGDNNLQSGGGNFSVPVSPLDPGVALGDLIPPTELNYQPPEFEEVLADEDDEPSILIQTPDQPAGAENATASVNEAGLQAPRAGNVPVESPGSNPSANSEATTGTIVFESQDDPNSVTINNVAVTAVGQIIAGTYGVLTITSIADGSIGYSYVLSDNTSGNATQDLFDVVIVDRDGDTDSATLTVTIIDDTPTANDDAASLTEGGPIAVTLDVDTNDVAGADGTQSRDFTSLTGTYGTITLNADGTQTYTLSASGQAAVAALAPGATLTDTFNYSLVDGDNDSDLAVLTVTLNGSDDPVVITGLGRTGGVEVVDEDDLPDGSSPNAGALTQTGTFAIDTPDGLGSLSVNGVTIINAGGLVAGQTVDTPAGLLSITGFTPTYAPNGTTIVGGTVSYSYFLQDNSLLHTGGNDGSLTESFDAILQDVDGSTDSATLTVTIIDDTPVANADVDSVTEGGPLIANGNVLTGADLGDANATDGVADVAGADGIVVTGVAFGVTAGVVGGAPLSGAYGQLTLSSGGDYVYTLDDTNPAVQALSAGATLTETFSYTITDGDGDVRSTTLKITINGSNDVPTVTVPQVGDASTLVSEAGLPARLGGEPAGSAAATDAEIVSGVISFTNGDGASIVTIDGFVGGATPVVAGANFVGEYGTLHIDSISFVTGTINYTYTLTDNVDNDTDATPTDTFTVTVSDSDGNPLDDASANLVITIADDTPVANADVDSVTEGGPLIANGNVLTGADLGDANATDGVADVAGADGIVVTGVAFGVTAGVVGGAPLSGAYGQLTLSSGGDYVYTLDDTNPAVQALSAGATLTETFSYTITDGDGDVRSTTLKITINGSNDVPTVTVPQVGDASTLVSEAGLPARLGGEPAGSAAATDAEIVSGVISFTNGDGASIVTIDGFVGGATPVVAGANFVGEYGTLHIDSISFVTGTINYTYTLTDNVDNDTDATPTDTFTVTVSDSDGNPLDDASANLVITIADDTPVANADVDSVTEGGPLIANGNVLTGADLGDANATDGVADVAGADGIVVTGVAFGVTAGVVGGAPLSGAYGQLTLSSGGDYVYTLDDTNPAVQALSAGATLTETFSYTITDGDGDVRSTTLKITINGSNDVPTVTVPQVGDASTLVSEAGLPARLGGEPAGSAAATDAEIVSGVISFTNGDGASIVTIDGFVGGATPVVAGANFVGEYGTLHIDSISFVTGTINYTYTLTDNVDNDTDATPTDTFTVTVSDSDGNPLDDASANLVITIADDTPAAVISAAGIALIHDESSGIQLDTDFAGALSVSASNPGDDPDVSGTGPIGYARSSVALSSAGSITGADGGTTVISLTLLSQGVDSGLDTTDGTNIYLFKEGQTIVGRVGSTTALAENGVAAFAIAVGAGNMLEMVQYLSIKHPTGGTASPDEMVTITNDVLRATTTVTDNDGDISTANASIGALVGFQDDAPSLTSVTDLLVPNQVNHSITGNIGFDYGADGPGQITLTAPSIAGLTFQTDPATGKITAFAGAQAYFSIVVDQATGQYTLDMLSTRPVVSTLIDFNNAAPGNYQAIGVSGATFNGVLFSGTLPTQFTNPDNSSDTINVSGNGFGVGSNLANDNEGFVFGYTNASALTFSLNFQPNTDSATVSWVAYTSDPLTGGTPIESGSSFVDKAGDADGIVPVTLDPTLNFNFLVVRIDYDKGIGARLQDFSVSRDVIPPNQVISFGVTITDGDGDRVVGVNGAEPDTSLDLTFLGGPSLPPVTPVALDTDHDGLIAYLGLEAGIVYDYNHDGIGEATAWVGAGDSILVRDADRNGTVSGASEFVFGNDRLTDLEALHAQYGDQLDANDADFVMFMVWNDANSDGVADVGELKSLSDAGISVIGLVSDGVASVEAGGAVRVAGESSFTYVNDNGGTSEGRLADVAFRIADRETELGQRFAGAATNAGVVAAAVAAMGLAAGQAAAHTNLPVADVRPAALDTIGLAEQAQATIGAEAAATSVSSSLMGNESKVAADDGQSAAGVKSSTVPSDAKLTDVSSDAQAPTELLSATEAPGHSIDVASPVAPMIVMPSTAALASLSGNAPDGVQHSGTVENSIVAALVGGAGGGDIDAILAGLPGDGNAALEALATPNGETVPGWDMGQFGHLQTDALMNIVSDVAALHHDAVQPAING